MVNNPRPQKTPEDQQKTSSINS